MVIGIGIQKSELTMLTPVLFRTTHGTMYIVVHVVMFWRLS